MKEYPLVMIDWLDHTADARWVENVDTCEPELCRTVGWLIKEDKKSYKVANAITKESGLGGISVILKSCVEEMWLIDVEDEEI
jgi:hypothetical protein|tara:strand:- start:163 stop:411 length:249 start_codon:yes stop_codon:yes gene_type:complete